MLLHSSITFKNTKVGVQAKLHIMLTWCLMEINGQLHTQATLPLIQWREGWISSRTNLNTTAGGNLLAPGRR